MNKNRFLLILQREYLAIVAKKSFIITTLLTPLLIVLMGAVPIILQMVNTSEKKVVAVIDETGKYAGELKSNDSFEFKAYDQRTNHNPRQLYEKERESLYAVVIIPQKVAESKQVLVYSESSLSPELMQLIETSINKTLTEAKIRSYGIDGLDKILKECNVEVDVRSIKWNENGDEELSSTELAMIVGVSLSLLSYFFVLMYGAMIMNSVIEEKTNRIVEVIVSSCKPIELMLGKIVGVALVGLTQVAVWVVLLGIIGTATGISLLGSAFMSPDALGTMSATPTPDTSNAAEFFRMLLSINYVQLISFFLIYFVGGFLLYASLFAGFGSAVDQASDASQFTTPIMIIIIIALYAAMACMQNPDGDVAFWCSLIPFSSPMVMMVRLPYDVPVWQTVLSIVLLYGTAIGFTAISAKIYRTGILLYGKKSSIKDVVTWIKPNSGSK